MSVGSGDGSGKVAVGSCGMAVWVGYGLGKGETVKVAMDVAGGVEGVQLHTKIVSMTQDIRFNTATPGFANILVNASQDHFCWNRIVLLSLGCGFR